MNGFVPHPLEPAMLRGNPPPASKTSLIHHTPTAIAVALAYFLTAHLGEALAFPSAPVSALWAPNAIVLAALVLAERQSWWIYLLFVLPAHLLAQLPLPDVPLSQVLIQYIANCLTAVIGAWALVAVAGERPSFDRLRTVVVLIVFGAVIAPFVSSLLMAGAFQLFGIDRRFWLTTTVRSLTNGFAILTLVPLIVHTANWFQAGRPLKWPRVTEACVLSIILVVVCTIVFAQPLSLSAQSPTLLYAPLPLLLWAAVRFGVVGACSSVLLLGAVATWGVLHGNGPFSAQLPVQNALSVVLFLTVVAASLLLIAALFEERSSMQSKRRELEALNDAVLASFQSQIAVLDRKGRIIAMNDSWQRSVAAGTAPRFDQTGTTDNYVQLCAQAASRGNPDAAALLEALVTVLRDPTAHRKLEIAFHTTEGPRWFDVSIEPLHRAEGGAVVTYTDVTPRKRMELEAREQRDQLAHLERAAMLGELSGALAHELNQPLTSILSNAEAGLELLKSGSGDQAMIAEILKDVAQDDMRAAQIIQRLRALLRRGTLAPQRVQLESLIQDTIELTHSDLVSRHIQLRLDLAANPPPVLADRVQIQQVILNLLMNACEAMEAVASPDCKLMVRTLYTDDTAQCTVADRGRGIEPSDIDRIFKPFFTTREQGLGLGLAICRSIIEAHGGQLWAESHPGQGAMLHFTLPLATRQTMVH